MLGNLPKQVVLVGNVATGKTTVLQQLSLHSSIRVVPADELFLVNPFFKLSKIDASRWDFTNDLWFLLRRVEMLQELFEENKTANQNIVIDSGIWMSYLYGYVHAIVEGHMTPDEWTFFEECFDAACAELPKPDVIVHLSAPFATLRERIEERGREFEVQHYFEYLHAMEKGLATMKAKVEGMGITYLEIETEQASVVKIAEKIIEVINAK